MRASGMCRPMSAMARDTRSGLTGPSMKAIGVMTRQMGEADSSTQMETSTKETGETTRRMELANIITLMEQSTRENGKTISNMVTVRRHGLTVPAMKEITNRERKMVMADSCGQMAPPMTASSLTTTSMARVSTPGLTIGHSMAIGLIIKCMDVAYLHGLMEELTKVNILMTKSKVSEYLYGLTAEDMRVSGSMGSSMDKESTLLAKMKRKEENGEMVKE